MKKNQVKLVGIGLLLTVVLLAYCGCSGGGGGGGGSSPSSSSASSVKGTTSGLLGTGLVLQNNGTDDLVVNPNEKNFRFSTRVKDGSACNITILSQPTSPAQSCEVINGSNRMVNGSDITDVLVSCQTTIVETFDSGELNSGYWNSSGEYDRKVVGGQLQFKLAAAGEFAYDYLGFEDTNCGKISADFTIIDTVFTGTGDKAFGTRLQSCGYHTATNGEAPGNRTGDVGATIIWSGTQAYYRVYRCLSDDCNQADSVEYLNPGGSDGELLGTTLPDSTATLSIDWNSTLAPEQFTFQLNNETPVNFDPVEGAPIDASVPNKPEKYLGPLISLSTPDDKAEMTAIVDNVMVDGLPYDNFDSGSGNYLDGSFWKKTNGRRQVENGRLVLESGQEFVDDLVADNRLNNTTNLKSQDDVIFKGEVVEAYITLDSATFVVDFGGKQAEASALLEMEFRPPGADKKNYTNFFVVRAALEEGPLGVTAVVLVDGCVDYSCTSKYTIANDNQKFATPVVKDQPYHMKIEHLGNGVFDITLDSNETLSVDLSTITGFALTELSVVLLRTSSRRTDVFGEEAFVRAFFDNVRVGNP